MGSIVEHRTYCRFCIALCGLVVRTDGDRVVGVAGDREHPLSGGYTCPKGRAIGLQHHSPDRLDHPELRGAPASWAEMLDDLASSIGRIVAESGPDAVAVYLGTASAYDASGRRMTERFLTALESRSKYSAATVDTVCKPYVAELMCGHPGAVPALDVEGATLVGFVGSNPLVSHGHVNAFPNPVARLRAIARRGGEIWVVDPRSTETARMATGHLAPRPGTDWAVLAHAVREVLRDGADREYVSRLTRAEDVATLTTAVAPYDLRTASRRSGVPEEALAAFVSAIRRHGRVAIQTGTGTTMSAAANVTEWLTWALHIVTGSYDRPGGMWFNPGFLRQLDRRPSPALTGEAQPPARSRPDVPARFGEFSCAVLADEIEAGNVRALLVAGGNPVTALPDAGRLRAALERLEVLAVLDILRTDTARLATHLLPCTGPLERADLPHFIDSFQVAVATRYLAAVVPAAAERRPAWWIVASLAERLGIVLTPDGRRADDCDDDVLLEVLARRARRPLSELKTASTGVVAEQAVFGWLERSVLSALPGGRWRLAPAELVTQLAELTRTSSEAGEDEPLRLAPRRQHRHLNSQLRDLVHPDGRRDRPSVLVHPDDAAARGIVDASLVEVASPTGTLLATVEVSTRIRRGAVSVTHGYEDANVARLTSGTLGVDPLTGQVLQCGIALRLRPAGHPPPPPGAPAEVIAAASRRDTVTEGD